MGEESEVGMMDVLAVLPKMLVLSLLLCLLE
jgi:hypothetical protein